MVRRLFVWLHRWAGLLMTLFLVIVGLTGSLLAFNSELEHLISPQLYAAPKPGATRLDAASLAERAEFLVPKGRARSISLAEPDQAVLWMIGRTDPATSEAFELGFNQLFLDPWTGEELGRRSWADISEGWINLMPFLYKLHFELALGMTGIWILGIVALVWTLDCFIGFYLTLPRMYRSRRQALESNRAGPPGFWRRWRPAWLVKWNAGAFRLNFDLHRAGGLWLWAALLIFAWSSVYMNLWDTVYTWATRAALDYRPVWSELRDLPQPLEQPRLDWRAALSTGERLMAEQAASHGFAVERPMDLSFDSGKGLYNYSVRSSRDIRDKIGRTQIYFDADTGALRLLDLPTGQYSGNTVTSWLAALHMADVFGLPWRIFVCALGLAVVTLSVTGVYIWWKKRVARKQSTARRKAPADVNDPMTNHRGASRGEQARV